jgi:alkyl hydroperoxide reductase subunit F
MTKQMIKVDLDGVFVQIGLLPNSGFIKDLVETTKFGEIIVDNKGRTSVKGIYAAGDVTTTPYKQIIIAMGEGAKAALAAFEDRMLQSPS